ncbi:MAG: DivIVA domain-containing protein [Oscillospiraceae bacterium]|nr:DivIVA domain-containing protein [Oscillospiraceae bacterium]
MGAKEIASKKFEMVLRGYKTDEVEDFLRDVSLDFSRMQKENEELEKKLEVLADKIREYREDEDTLKDALLGAQRQGNALIADSKRKAAEIIEEAQSKSDSILKKAEEERRKLQERGENEIAAAGEEAALIIETAKKRAADIQNAMNLLTDNQKEVLHRTTTEIAEFKQRVVDNYKQHIQSIEKISEVCENEFIREALKSYSGEPKLKEYIPEPRENGRENNRNNRNRKRNEQHNQNKQKPGGNNANSGNNGNNGDDARKFEIDVDEFAGEHGEPRDDEVIGMKLDAILALSSETSDLAALSALDAGDTGEVAALASKTDVRKTNEIFFDKNTMAKSKSK